MPALSFKKYFVPAILNGKKTLTIRAFRKQPIKAGDHLYLYTAMRTKQCEKIGEAVCLGVAKVTITKKGIGIKDFFSGLVTDPHDLDGYAKQDGFEDWEHMRRWWTFTHQLPFKGIIIYWENFIPV